MIYKTLRKNRAVRKRKKSVFRGLTIESQDKISCEAMIKRIRLNSFC